MGLAGRSHYSLEVLKCLTRILSCYCGHVTFPFLYKGSKQGLSTKKAVAYETNFPRYSLKCGKGHYK